MREFFRKYNSFLLWGFFIGAMIVRTAVVMYIGEEKLVAEWKPLVHYLVHEGNYLLAFTDSGILEAEKLKNPAHVIPSNYMPPGYPFLLAFFFSITGFESMTFWIVQSLQIAMALLTMYLFYRLVCIKFSRGTATIAAGVFAFYPVLVYYPSQISAVNLYLTLNMLMVYLLFKGEREKRIIWFLAGGFCLGLLILSRAQMFIYLPVFAVWLFSRIPKNRWKVILSFVIPVLLVIVPWATRNYMQFDRFTPFPFTSGFNLWRGNNAVDIGVYPSPDSHEPEVKEITSELRRLEIDERYEIRRDSVYRRAALTYIGNHPLKTIQNAFAKLFHYWTIEPDYSSTHPFYWIPWFLMLPFFITGLYFTGMNPGKYAIFYMYFIISTGTVMVFFVLPRYRLIILPFVIAFAAFGVTQLCGDKKDKF